MTINCTPDSFSAAIEALFNKEEKALEQCVDEASKLALGRSYVASQPIAENKFKEYVNEFYSAYSPMYYARSYDMQNVLEITTSESDMAFNYDWNESAMNQYERGGSGSLAELTVGYGFHGGAAGTDHNNVSVSSPHYRAPVGLWWHWGNTAVSSESPYDQFMEWLSHYFESAEYLELYNQYFQSAILELMPKYLV